MQLSNLNTKELIILGGLAASVTATLLIAFGAFLTVAL